MLDNEGDSIPTGVSDGPVIVPNTASEGGTDDRYFELIATALRVCSRYQPKLGRGRAGGANLEQFRQLYGADPFYHWIGLDSPLMYAAHKAAGGMTSIYRQLGIGCQWVLSAFFRDTLGLSADEATWAYQVPTASGSFRSLYLDGRIDLGHVREATVRRRVETWLADVKAKVVLHPDLSSQIKGVVFEARQGYKSKDSKRQNADIANATNAIANLYIPVLFLFSTQIDGDVAARYMQAKWLILPGTLTGQTTDSAYVFCRDVLHYDLAGFFERNSPRLKAELEGVLGILLEAQT